MERNRFWAFKAKDEKRGELTLYGEISNYTWFGDEITPNQFKADLDALGDIETLDIYINSGGGDVFAGQAIHSMLKRHRAHKTVHVDGYAASIASIVAMAGDEIIMPKNAMMMIHNAWTFASGNANKFRKLADDMEKIDGVLTDVYVDKTGLPSDRIREMMDAETWMTAEEAFANHFATQVSEPVAFAASDLNLERYRNAPTPPEPQPEQVKFEQPNDSGGESRPVADNHVLFQNIRKKILQAYKEE